MRSIEPNSINWFRRNGAPAGASFGTTPPNLIPVDYAGVVGPRTAPLAARIRRRRLTTAAALSAGLHGLFVLGLLLQHTSAPFGATGANMGTGIQVSLVAGFAAGGPDAGEHATSILEADIQRDRLEPETPEVLTGGEAAATDAPAPQERQEPTQAPSETSLALGELGQAAGLFDGLQGASPSAGGDPLAVSDLLAQIARCLRPGLRPALGFSQLSLTIGADGRLQARPEVVSALPRLAAGDRLAADQIVQAALLCGPYAHPDLVNRTVSVAADFSRVEETAAMAETRPRPGFQ